MRIATTKVQCRGCQAAATLKFEAPSFFQTAKVPFTCKKCGSDLLAFIKKEPFRDRIAIKVNMVKHTQTLLNILKRRGNAQSNAKG